jgi:Site-specific recombinase XerD
VVTARRLKEEIQKRLGPPEDVAYDFLSFAEERLEEYRRREQFSTFESYRSDLRKFKQFVEDEYGVDELPFDAIDVELLESYRTFCYEVRENSANTVGKALGTLRVFLRKALAEGKARSYPFEYIEIDSEPVQKDLLTPEEIEQIADLDLDEESFLAEVRRWFVFAFYTGGMRFSDVATLQWQHIRPGPSEYMRVYWKMQKTSDNVGVPLTEDARQILSHCEDGSQDDWVFPILEGVDPGDGRAIYDRKRDQGRKANEELQELAGRAGIEKNVSFHLSRNAAAWYLHQNVGDIYQVRDFLGHSSVKQTEAYIDRFEDESKDEVFLEAME